MAFRIFRLVVGLIVGTTGLWLIAGSVASIMEALSGAVQAQALVIFS